jgi:ABC-type uncharacterized transport system permease subunit
MTFLDAVQVLFVASLVMFAVGLGGIMIENSTDDPRWMAPMLAGLGFLIVLAIVWGTLEPKQRCCPCPAEQGQRP